MRVVNSTKDADLRHAAEKRYPYLSRYGRDLPLHIACCLCYPQPPDASRSEATPVAWDRHSTYRREAV